MEDKGLQLAKQVVKYYFDSYPIEKEMLKSAVDILDKNEIDILKEYKAAQTNTIRKNFPDICDILASLEGKDIISNTFYSLLEPTELKSEFLLTYLKKSIYQYFLVFS